MTFTFFCSERFWQLYPVQFLVMRVRAEDTAKAVNLLIEVGRNDQQALLEVLQRHFTSTDQESGESDKAYNIEKCIEAVDADRTFTCVRTAI